MRKLHVTWQRMRNIPGLKRDVGLLVGLIVVGLIAAGSILSHYNMITPWSDEYVFSAEFDQTPALQLASRQEVRIAGVTVGRIVDAQPTERGTAKLTMSIDRGHTVYENARAIMRSKTPLNVMYVTLQPGGVPAKPLPDKGVLPVSQTERVLQPYELLDELDPRARAALTQLVTQADVALAKAPDHLPGGLKATDAAMKSFEPVVTQLQKRRDNIARLVTAASQISSAAGRDDKRLASLATALEETLIVVAKRDKELGASLAQLPGLTKTLRGSMNSAAALTDELNPTLDSLNAASGKLPDALKRLTKTVHEADGLVRAAGPVVRKARPVLADLRPLSADLSSALGDLGPVVSLLPDATARIVPWLDDLGAFVYQTSSSFSLGDANGGLGRAHLVIKVTDPTGGGL